MTFYEKVRSFGNSRAGRLVSAAVVAAVVILAVFLILASSGNRTFTSYEIIGDSQENDGVSEYAYVEDGYLVRYSPDGAVLLDSDSENVWNVTYSFSDPETDVCGDRILIYDRGGTEVYIYNEKERTAAFTTDASIRSARVSERGTAAVLLDDGENTRFVYYSSDGTKIAEGTSSMSDPGYAFGLAVSGDGMYAAVSYLTVSGGKTGTTVRFYGFDSSRNSSGSSQVGELAFDGVFAPEVEFLSGDDCAVIRDDGFTVVKNPAKPEDSVSVDFDDEIVSTFHSRSRLGFVFDSTDRTHLYEIRFYTAGGKLEQTSFLDFSYSGIRVCGNDLIACGNSDAAIFGMNGKMKYSGTFGGGTLTDVLRTGKNRYLVVTDQAVMNVRLK